MGYNENFSKAVYRHEVSGAKLGEYMMRIIGKPEAEKQKLLEQIAKEIEATCPYKPGREPGQTSTERGSSTNETA